MQVPWMLMLRCCPGWREPCCEPASLGLVEERLVERVRLSDATNITPPTNLELRLGRAAGSLLTNSTRIPPQEAWGRELTAELGLGRSRLESRLSLEDKVKKGGLCTKYLLGSRLAGLQTSNSSSD